MTHKVIIIGSGPAGYTAAIYASRASLEPLLFEGSQPGGQLLTTTDVENYPGFPKGILGPDLIKLWQDQAERFGAKIYSQEITRVDLQTRPFKVWTGEEEFQAETLIISTGASAKRLGLESEKKYFGRGVSACATCDGAFFRNKEVAVIGGGDSAMEEALFLTKFAIKVTVLVRSEALRASKIMQDRVRANSKINFIWSAEVLEVLGDEKRVTGLRVKNNATGGEKEMKFDGMFVAIGHAPNTKIFVDQLELDALGYIITKLCADQQKRVSCPLTTTSVPGVFACGDVMDPRYRQAVTAAGTGCMAAIDVEKYLEHNTITNF